jgi:hypothetical protein
MNKQARRDCLELRGKTLPVVFTKGLMGAIIDIFGYSGGAPELLRLTVADILPTLQRWQNWFSLVAILNPLCAYYRSDLGHPEPVDYAFLERLRHAIDQLYPQGGAYLAQQIGWSWWINDFPLARRWYSSYGLHHLLGTTIVQTLQQTTFQAPSGKHVDEARFLWSEQQRVRTACRSFAQAIQQESGIVCTIKEWERVLLIHFSECPFCANALPDCNIFFGLVERMILWLYGEHRLDRLPTVHHSLCSEVTGGIVDVRPIHNDSHTIAVLFAPREHGFEKSH